MRLACALVVLSLLGCAADAQLGSIGAVLGRDPDDKRVFVRETPDAREDADPPLLPGDEILMVEGVFVRDISTEDLRRLLRGKPGTKVKLTIARGEEILRLELVRTPLRESLVRPKEERLAE